MSTELDEAKLWYATAPDFDSYPEMLDAFHKHMLAISSVPQQDVGAGRYEVGDMVVFTDSAWVFRPNEDIGAHPNARNPRRVLAPPDRHGHFRIDGTDVDYATGIWVGSDEITLHSRAAGRAVPSPVGQAQQDSDVLGDAEDGPRSTLQVLASEGSGLSTAIAIAPAHKAQYPQLDESGILLIFSEDEEDTLHIGELQRDIGVARETMAKCGRDLFGEFDFICGPDSGDVGQWYPVDNIKATIEAAHTMFDALYRQALAQGIGKADEGGSHSDATEPLQSPTAIPIADAPKPTNG